MNNEVIKQSWINIITALGLDVNSENFKDTPDRIVREYNEIFAGLNCKQEIEKILKTSFPTTYDGMVIEHPIVCHSMCPHHFLPVIYEVSIGYIPESGGLGLSKLPRLVELLSKAPKLQEDFTKEVVDTLQNAINPKGVMVVVKGQHMCMQMRGVKKPGCATTTSSFTGVFKEKEAREEFLRLIN
jgi:GTP cyclohydrolase I